jgi:hypothetical protein
MNEFIIPAANIIFLVASFGLALLLALSVYIYVRYGRTPSVTIPSSIMVIVFFVVAVLIAYNTLQNIIQNYA